MEIDQHFFVHLTSSHPIILGESYITTTRMETKVLDNVSAYAKVKNQNGQGFVQFLIVRPNQDCSKDSLKGESGEDCSCGLLKSGTAIARYM